MVRGLRSCTMRTTSAIGWIVPDLVVGVHDAHKQCAVIERGSERLEVDETLMVYRKHRHADAVLRECLRFVQHRVVLDRADDDVVASRSRRRYDAAQREVIGLGSAAREDELVWLCSSTPATTLRASSSPFRAARAS